MNNITNSDINQNSEDELLPEYDFDYSKASPNRFVIQVNEAKITVTLESDVAKVFKTSEDVNKVLRAILSAIPER